MQKYNIKNILLGIGIGVVITSGTGMLYSSSVSSKEILTKDEIIQKAEEYGMVKKSQIFVTAAPSPKVDATVAPITTPTPITLPTPTYLLTPSPAPTATPEPSVEVTITVNSGDTAVIVADKLIQAKVITDKEVFVNQMINSGGAYTIFAGSYNMKQGMSIEEVIKALTTRKEF